MKKRYIGYTEEDKEQEDSLSEDDLCEILDIDRRELVNNLWDDRE